MCGTAPVLPAPCLQLRPPSLQENMPAPPVHLTARPTRPQHKDRLGFHMSSRHEMYAELLARYVRPDFQPQVIRDPSL